MFTTICRASKPLLTSMPELVQQWHPSKNGTLAPSDVTLGSNKRVWWQCTACLCGQLHEWQAAVSGRACRQKGCPVCAGQRTCACSSLVALRPDLAQQWDPAGNGDFKPEDASLGSGRLVQWICYKHRQPYTWTSKVNERTRKRMAAGCTKCGKASLRSKWQRTLSYDHLPVSLPATSCLLSGQRYTSAHAYIGLSAPHTSEGQYLDSQMQWSGFQLEGVCLYSQLTR